MTELSINSKNTGITFALADYAKTVNGGKAVKLTKKQWAEVMAKVAELNSKRKETTGDRNFRRCLTLRPQLMCRQPIFRLSH